MSEEDADEPPECGLLECSRIGSMIDTDTWLPRLPPRGGELRDMMRPRSAKYCSLSWKRHATRAAEQASHFDEFRDCTHLIFFRRLVRNEKWRMSIVRI